MPIILEELQNRKRQRRWSVHPLWKYRSQQGEFQIYNTLIDHEDKFYNYFKMSRNTFDALTAGMHRTPNSGRELRSEPVQVEASSATEWGAAEVVEAEPHRLPQGFPEFDAPKISTFWGILKEKY